MYSSDGWRYVYVWKEGYGGGEIANKTRRRSRRRSRGFQFFEYILLYFLFNKFNFKLDK